MGLNPRREVNDGDSLGVRFLLLGQGWCLEQADVVLYDQLINRAVINHAPLGAELVYVGKQAGRHCFDQGEIQKLLTRKVREGKTVVRLKGGDPFVFGRGGEEAEVLQQLPNGRAAG